MKNTMIILVALLLSVQLWARQQEGFSGFGVQHYRYSAFKGEYLFTERLNIPTSVVFTPTHLMYKKGTADWRVCPIEFKTSGYSADKGEYKIYDDDTYNQRMIYYAGAKEIWFYYDYDAGTSSWESLAIYEGISRSQGAVTAMNAALEAAGSKKEERTTKSDQFRRDYTHFTIYDPAKKAWDAWSEGNNTFVFNANSNSDILFFNPKGEKKTFRNLGGKEEGWLEEDNEHYQIIKMLDYDGDEVFIQLFDNPKIGLKLMYPSGVIIQFSNAE